MSQLTSSLKTPKDQLAARVADLAASLKAAEKRIAQFEAKALESRLPELAATAQQIGAYRVVAQTLGTAASADDVRTLALQIRERVGAGAVVALGADVGGRPIVIVATDDAARGAGAKAGVLAKTAAGVLGGGGGGRDDVAQGGGTDVSALPSALTALTRALETPGA